MTAPDNAVTTPVATLPTDLYTAAAVRELDRITIDEFAIAGIQLMQRAGRAAFAAVLENWPACQQLHVFCGTGKNGGDGFIVAALARQRGLEVTVWQVGATAKIHGDALAARSFAEREQVEINIFNGVVPQTGIIVDALLGTGLSGVVRVEFVEAIAAINNSALPVLALDIPSGLCSDTGQVLGSAVNANVTISFIGLKQGLFTGSGPHSCGRVLFADLNVPSAIYQRVPATAKRLLLEPLVSTLLPRRPRTAHKGWYGHVLVVGGDYGMAGAVTMAAQAAARVGPGLVSCATRPEHIPAVVARCPEVMVHGVRSRADLELLLARATTVVVGPGLGQQAWGQQLLQCIYEFLGANSATAVIDADALNMLAERRIIAEPHCAQWVLTPHPGEAARLLACSNSDIQRDRIAAAQALQQRYGGVVILKGAGTVVAADSIGISNYGNPGMASGGMGDVLSGVLGGLLAQGLALSQAADVGTCLHGSAADLAAVDGERGLLATDLLPYLRRLVNP